MKKAKISSYLKKRFETTAENYAEWFGYYNYDPLNHDQSKMLCNRSKTESKSIKSTDQIELGYYDIPNGAWHHIGYSDSWNWPQGAMMQWLPGIGNENKVIYNCSREGRLVSKIVDTKMGGTKDLDWAIYGITPDGKKSIALDLERSYWCRAYHYQSVANPKKEGRIYEDDGIFEIDLVNNTRKKIISIQDIIKLEADDDFDQKKHWIEHIMISPDGTRFCFLHRYSSIDNVLQYKTRLFVAKIDGSDMQVIPGWNDFSWSHFGWRNENSFTIYSYKNMNFKIKHSSQDKNENSTLKKSEKVSLRYRCVNILLPVIKKILPKKIIKKMAKRKSYYQYYECIDNKQFFLKESWIKKYFEIDGHPSFATNGRYMLTDTYPDSRGYRQFIVFDIKTHKGKVLSKMPENQKPGGANCDLHPKVAGNGKFVIFDTTYSGKHSMILFEIEWNKIIKALS